MAKVLSFPDGAEVPVEKTKTKETIADHQTKKFADSLADDVVIQMISALQQDGLNIGTSKGTKTFLDVGIFLEALRGMIYREFDLEHPFHNISDKMMQTIDSINYKYGSSTLKIASEGIEKAWNMKRENVSPCYTTRFEELVEVKS